jgi:hypothetical protein
VRWLDKGPADQVAKCFRLELLLRKIFSKLMTYDRRFRNTRNFNSSLLSNRFAFFLPCSCLTKASFVPWLTLTYEKIHSISQVHVLEMKISIFFYVPFFHRIDLPLSYVHAKTT